MEMKSLLSGEEMPDFEKPWSSSVAWIVLITICVIAICSSLLFARCLMRDQDASDKKYYEEHAECCQKSKEKKEEEEAAR